MSIDRKRSQPAKIRVIHLQYPIYVPFFRHDCREMFCIFCFMLIFLLFQWRQDLLFFRHVSTDQGLNCLRFQQVCFPQTTVASCQLHSASSYYIGDLFDVLVSKQATMHMVSRDESAKTFKSTTSAFFDDIFF